MEVQDASCEVLDEPVHALGVRHMSTVEGTHAECKYWLGSSCNNIYTVFKKLMPWWITNISVFLRRGI